MKNVLILLSVLLSQPMFCQAQRVTDFLTNLVAPLDKTEITSNFLWDKGISIPAHTATLGRNPSTAHNPQPGKRRSTPQPDPDRVRGCCGL